MSYLPPVLQLLLALLVIPAGIFDIRERRVPNWLTLSGVLVGIGMNSFLYESAGFWLSLKGLGLALLVYFPLFAIRAMGAGDAKLMAAVGAMAGPWNWLGIFFLTALMGGVFAVLLLVTTGRTRRTLSNVGYLLKELAYFRAPYMKHEELDIRSPKAVGLPHGAVIALAALGFLAAAAIWAPH
ncbi:MAG: prepilin peptidase [Bryobacterales bacterium]|nr:prepilin peptidase [Bryobacterales bacterium]